jgi:hypothetical protein
MIRLIAATAVCAASIGAMAAAPAAADQPAVSEFESTGPAPMVTAACGFPVTRDIFITIKTFPAPETTTPFDRHAIIHATGTFTGPTGRSFSATTNDSILVRELSDGTLVEIDAGQTLSFRGRAYDFGGDAMTVSGQSINPASYCDQLAP